VYGGMKFDTIPAWIIPHKKIVLEENIKSGRFADIFKARYDTKQNDMSVVVAKTLQGIKLDILYIIILLSMQDRIYQNNKLTPL
jgi:hypothetical protein